MIHLIIERIRLFFRRIYRLPKVLRTTERRIIAVLLVIIFISGTWVIVNFAGTKPAYGGIFSEGFVGQPTFINPVLAVSQTDLDISEMIYSGLTKIDSNGNVEPDLATSWLSPDGGRTYIYHLRSNVYWHDGAVFSSNDVVYTVNLIKDPTNKNPMYQFWKDVQVTSSGPDVVIFSLPDQLATFPWMTGFGIVPEHVGINNLNTDIIGTGPYKMSKIVTNNGLIQSIILVRNPQWYGPHLPYINAIDCEFYPSASQAIAALNNQDILAYDGVGTGQKNFKTYSIRLTQSLSLFLNTKSGALSDINIRKQLLTTSDLMNGLVINLAVDSTDAKNQGFSTLVSDWKSRHIQVNVTSYPLTTLTGRIVKQQQYDALAVTIDDGPQTDPYAYWHSSQASGNGLNFTNVSDSSLDKLLVSQRTTTDMRTRSNILNQINSIISNLYVQKVISSNSLEYSISKSVHVVPVTYGSNPADRFENIDQWYINTRI